MKNSKWILISSLLVILMLVVAACGGSEATQAPEEGQSPSTQADTAPQPTNTTPPTDPPPPDPPAPTDTTEPEPMGEIELDPASLGEPLNLSSFRSTMSVVITGITDGQEFEESIDFVIEQTTDPLAQHIIMSGEGFEDAEGMDSFEMYLVEGMMYMKMGEEWLSMPADEGEMLSNSLISPDTIIEDTCGWKKKEKTEIDGVAVQRWTISKEDMETCMPPEQLTQMGEITDAGGDVFIAEDGNYVAQMDMFYEGNNLDLGIEATDQAVQEGRMEIHFKITDVNQELNIELPEAALASGATPEDIPIPDDAQLRLVRSQRGGDGRHVHARL